MEVPGGRGMELNVAPGEGMMRGRWPGRPGFSLDILVWLVLDLLRGEGHDKDCGGSGLW